jgi:hypothetical protein
MPRFRGVRHPSDSLVYGRSLRRWIGPVAEAFIPPRIIMAASCCWPSRSADMRMALGARVLLNGNENRPLTDSLSGTPCGRGSWSAPIDSSWPGNANDHADAARRRSPRGGATSRIDTSRRPHPLARKAGCARTRAHLCFELAALRSSIGTPPSDCTAPGNSARTAEFVT